MALTHKRVRGTFFRQYKVVSTSQCLRVSSGVEDPNEKGETIKPLGGNTEYLCAPAITKMFSTEHKTH